MALDTHKKIIFCREKTKSTKQCSCVYKNILGNYIMGYDGEKQHNRNMKDRHTPPFKM